MKKKKKANPFFDVDLNNLDREWAMQAKRIKRFCDEASYARKRHAEAKAKLDVVESTLFLNIKADPKAYGMDATSDKAVEHKVTTMKEYRQALQNLIDAKFALDIVEGSVEALQHKKPALQNEVTMFLAGYFGDPKAPKTAGGVTALDEMRKKKVR